MSTRGLVRRPHYEEVLKAAHKDQASQQGILGVGLQNFATRAINSPLFQRVQMGIEEKMLEALLFHVSALVSLHLLFDPQLHALEEG